MPAFVNTTATLMRQLRQVWYERDSAGGIKATTLLALFRVPAEPHQRKGGSRDTAAAPTYAAKAAATGPLPERIKGQLPWDEAFDLRVDPLFAVPVAVQEPASQAAPSSTTPPPPAAPAAAGSSQ